MTTINAEKTCMIVPDNKPPISFADVLRAVDSATGLSLGVRGNLRAAIERCAGLMGPQQLSRTVDVHAIARMLGKLTAAKLGFKNQNSLAAFRSNLRRALRLGGIKIMDGKAHIPLLPDWAALTARMKAIDVYLCPPLSRFLHYASEQSWGVDQIGAQAFEQFGQAVRQTSLNSKAEKTIRNTAKAWKKAQQTIAGWPEADLAYQPRRREVVSRPWSTFPASLEIDARAFVTRDDLDLVTEDQSLKPLKPRTQQNYLDGIRRAASIAVILGRQPDQLRQLADLTPPELVRQILTLLRERTKRQTGGHVEFIAMLLLVIGRDYIRMAPVEIARLTRLWKATHQPGMAMSERTFTRLRQFDDEAYVQAFLDLPSRLMALAEKVNPPTVGSAKLARAALFLRLLVETAARQGNIVGLDLNRHVMIEGDGRKLRAWIMIPESEVKNGEPIRAELSLHTAHMLRRYIGRYRHIHCCGDIRWLFPRQDGSHWTSTQACTDLKDLAARHVGIDVTPHVIRSFAGKLILDAHPGALGEVQQLLGHRSVTTTQAFYAPIDRAKVRARYQGVLSDRTDRR